MSNNTNLVRDIIPPEEKTPDVIPPENKKSEFFPVSGGAGPKKYKNFTHGKKIYALGSLALVFALVIFLFPGKGYVEIAPKMEPLLLDAPLVIAKGDRAVDFEKAIIPGFQIDGKNELSMDFYSTGKKTTEKKAEGTIRVTNNSNASQTLIVNTRFQASSDKFQPQLSEQEKPWFRTKEKITIAAKGYKDVMVVAENAGEKYNIGPAKFSIPGLVGTSQYTLVFGESFAMFQGGMKSEASQVAPEDLARARAEVQKEAKEQAADGIKGKVSAGFVLLEDSVSIDILENYLLAKAGDQADKFSAFVSARSQALTFREKDLEDFALQYVLSNIPGGKDIKQNSLKISYSSNSYDAQSQSIKIFAKIEAQTYSVIDENLLKKSLSSKSKAEAESFLSGMEQISRVKVKISPFWRRSLPKDEAKIEIAINVGKS